MAGLDQSKNDKFDGHVTFSKRLQFRQYLKYCPKPSRFSINTLPPFPTSKEGKYVSSAQQLEDHFGYNPLVEFDKNGPP